MSGRRTSCQGLAVWGCINRLGLAVDGFQQGIPALGKGSPAPGGSAQTLPGSGEQPAQQQMPEWNRSPSPGSTSPLLNTPTVPGPRSQGCSPPFLSPCRASSQLLQTREPSSLCLLLLLPLARSGGRAQLGLSVPETSTGKWEWLMLLPARLPAREALALSPKPGTLGAVAGPAWGRRRCWCCSRPLGSLQRGCFPCKQHCSTHTRRDLQCREKPPTRRVAACGQGEELGAGLEQLCSHCPGSTLLLLPRDSSWAIPASGTLTPPGEIMEIPWALCPEDRALPRGRGSDALLLTALRLLPPSNAGFPQPAEQGQGGWHGWHGWHH